MEAGFDSDSTETALGVVLTTTSRTDPHSLYVRVPRIGKDRRTDGGATDMNTTKAEFEGDIDNYERGDYVTLTFEPKKYGDNHVLTHVASAGLVAPSNVDEPTFGDTDIPRTCPSCGRTAAAAVKTKYDSMVGGKVSSDADACSISPDNRGAWFDFSAEVTFVHGLE